MAQMVIFVFADIICLRVVFNISLLYLIYCLQAGFRVSFLTVWHFFKIQVSSQTLYGCDLWRDRRWSLKVYKKNQRNLNLVWTVWAFINVYVAIHCHLWEIIFVWKKDIFVSQVKRRVCQFHWNWKISHHGEYIMLVFNRTKMLLMGSRGHVLDHPKI